MTLSATAFGLLLFAATVTVLFLTLLIWWRTRSICFPIGVAALYFWSLHGGWILVYDRIAGTQRPRYEYLYTKLFPVQLDVDYALTLVLYAAFIVLVQGTVLFLVSGRGPGRTRTDTVLYIRHSTLLLITLMAGVGSYALIRPYLSLAVALGLPAYGVISSRMISAAIPFYTVQQFLMGLALFAAAIGMAISASGPHPRYVRGSSSRWIAVAYLFLFLGLTALSLALGKKNELFFALLTGGLFYLTNAFAPRRWALTAMGVLGMLALGFVDLVRSVPFARLGESNRAKFEVSDAMTALLASNEAFGAQFSLYGALRYKLQPTYGASLPSLASAAVPKAFGFWRPEDSYGYYARGVKAMDDQQYSIHHATGWYLNFGVPGTFLGALLLGALWAWLYRRSLIAVPEQWLSGPAAALAFCAFSAGIPMVVRAGPEAYKAVVVELILMPAGLLTIARYRIGIGIGMRRYNNSSNLA